MTISSLPRFLNAASASQGLAARQLNSPGSIRKQGFPALPSQRAVSFARQVPVDTGTGLATLPWQGGPVASQTLTPAPAPAATSLDVPNMTLAAGSVFNGMVSAGPLSSGLASMHGPAPAASGTRLLAMVSDAGSFNNDPVALLKDRLAKLGVNTGTIQFERWTDQVATPGGSRTSQYVRANFGNGVTENYAVERVLQNPDTAAGEIKSLILRGFAPA